MSKFPNRPNHPDFWLIAQALQDHDRQAEGGQKLDEIIGRYIHEPSMTYVATERAKIRLSVSMPGVPLYVTLAGMWVDGFLAGMAVQAAKSQEKK